MAKRFGIEIEFTGITRLMTVRALETLFQTEAIQLESSVVDSPYLYHKVADPTGLLWSVVRDRSITSEFFPYNAPDDLVTNPPISLSGTIIEDLEEYKVEVVSPVLTLSDMPILLRVLNVLKDLGGVVNNTTGIHIHIDAPESPLELLDILRRFCEIQDSLVSEFNIADYRLNGYCKLYPINFVTALSNTDINGRMYTIHDVYYFYLAHLRKGVTERHPHPERYYALNLASLEKLNTIEFRFFNSSLDGEVVEQILDWVMQFSYGLEPLRAVSSF
ncbi:putative amidoligase enzyme [compost metagenome]